MLVVCARVKGVMCGIEISPYKAAERGCEVDNVIHDLMCSWFLVDIKDLDPINSKPQEVPAMYELMLLGSSALPNIGEDLWSFLSP